MYKPILVMFLGDGVVEVPHLIRKERGEEVSFNGLNATAQRTAHHSTAQHNKS